MIGTQCPTCKHYTGSLKCAAYPERIPADILKGLADHNEPQPDDNGIRYSPAEDE